MCIYFYLKWELVHIYYGWKIYRFDVTSRDVIWYVSTPIQPLGFILIIIKVKPFIPREFVMLSDAVCRRSCWTDSKRSGVRETFPWHPKGNAIFLREIVWYELVKIGTNSGIINGEKCFLKFQYCGAIQGNTPQIVLRSGASDSIT